MVKKVLKSTYDLRFMGLMARETRKRAELSQKEMAKLCGCNQSYISKFESGNADSAVILLKYIQKGLDPWLLLFRAGGDK